MNKKFSLKKSTLKYFYVDKPPTEKALEHYYSNLYFKTNPRYSKKKSKKFEEKYYEYQTKIRIEFLKIYKKHGNLKLLDLGAGTGRFLYYSKKYLKKAIGVDFNNKHLKYKLPKNIKFFSKNPLEFIIKEDLDYDFITLNNIVEHSDKVNELFSTLKKKIKKNTLILITIPNDFSDMQIALKKSKFVKNKYWVSYPDHLTYFNNKNFINFIKKHKFKLVDAISDFPIETLLFDNNFNYINNKFLGKSAHYLRCKFTNFIYENCDINDIMNYFRSCYKLGIGRNNLFIIKK